MHLAGVHLFLTLAPFDATQDYPIVVIDPELELRSDDELVADWHIAPARNQSTELRGKWMDTCSSSSAATGWTFLDGVEHACTLPPPSPNGNALSAPPRCHRLV
jgi:hypothetical protein